MTDTSIPEYIIVEKALGISSTAIVNYYKRFYNQRTGHGGTLDPLAVGKLVILLGKGTKKANSFLDHPKVYDMEVLLGAYTRSYDLEQPLIVDKNAIELNEKKVIDIVKSFSGTFMQKVPVFSALKQNGLPQYKLAHQKAKNVVVKERLVTVTLKNEPLVHILSSNDLVTQLGKKITSINNAYLELVEMYDQLQWKVSGKDLFLQKTLIEALRLTIDLVSLPEYASKSWTTVSFSAEVSKGTYMRALARDIGEALQTYGLTLSLSRKEV